MLYKLYAPSAAMNRVILTIEALPGRKRMKAAILRTAKQPLHVEETPKPQPAAGQVLLRVRACGVCRTDLHIVEGELPPRKGSLIPGHQIVGDVVEGGTDRKSTRLNSSH